MRRKKLERLKEEKFWADFCDFNLPDGVNEIPTFFKRVNFRRYNVDDEGLLRMVGYVRSIVQLDLDGTDITNEGIRYLTQLESLKELRLKECMAIDNGCIDFLCEIQSLELLHLGGTEIIPDGLEKIGCLRNLKLLLISASEGEEEFLSKIEAALPPDCEFLVNHKAYERKRLDHFSGFWDV